MNLQELDSYQEDNPGPRNNPKGLMTQMPFWRIAKQRRWGFTVLMIADRIQDNGDVPENH